MTDEGPPRVLLYGATGHTGRAIAERFRGRTAPFTLTLAAREREVLQAMAKGDPAANPPKPDFDFRVFGLDDRQEVVRELGGFTLVVNAAGPFALTGDVLAKAAIEAGCSYLDINGELDVYMKMDDLARQADKRGVALVSSAGQTATASSLLLSIALRELKKRPEQADRRLGAIRIALTLPARPSSGSAATAARLAREQVLVIRRGKARRASGTVVDALVKFHEPAGRLDRTFRFGEATDPGGPMRMASAANMVDTLAALQQVERAGWDVDSIESYLAMDLTTRVTFQAASALSPLTVVPAIARQTRIWAEEMVKQAVSPRPEADRDLVILEIDDPWRRRLVEWRLSTPVAYDFTALLVEKLVEKLVAAIKGSAGPRGWVVPAELLDYADAKALERALPECRVQKVGGKVEERP